MFLDRGLLIRGGDVLEAASHVDTIVFDKTGTLTVGRPAVTRIIPLGDRDPAEMLAMAAAVERQTTHPLAKAVVAAADSAGELLIYEPRRKLEWIIMAIKAEHS